MTATQTTIDAMAISGAASLSAGSGPPRATGQIALEGRVLLAEDGADNRQIISLHLRKAGAEVVLAENGRIAVDVARSRPLDLILMDIEMPELDGYDATRLLRASGCTLPIVALTAHSEANDHAKCLAAGCTDYITKPIEKNKLLLSVASYLSGGRSGNAVCRPAPVANPSPLVGQGLRSSFADDPTMHVAIAEFVDLLPYRVAIIERLLREGNLIELRRVIHQIKGAGGGYGFDPITQYAAQADQSLKEQNSPEIIAGQVDLLVGLIRTVEGYQPTRERFHV